MVCFSVCVYVRYVSLYVQSCRVGSGGEAWCRQDGATTEGK